MRLVITLAAALPLLVAAAPAHAAAACANADLAPRAGALGDVRAATLCLLNRERVARGKPRLGAHGDLQRSATRFSRAMVARAFFAHVGPGGATMMQRIRATGYLSRARRAYRVGENLAWGTGERATPRETVAAWMRSPGHRANLLDARYRAAGVGVAVGVPVDRVTAPGATYTTHFGSLTTGA